MLDDSPTTSTAFASAPRAASSPAVGRTRIGLFDSGVGGLSVLVPLAKTLPRADLVYIADQKYCPYGARPAAEIRARSLVLARFLLAQGCQIIVVACNTASAAALYYLREQLPDVPIVGMEPAIKTAAAATRSGKVAVLATRSTLEGELFANTRREFAGGIQVRTVYPEDWVELVERGELHTPDAVASVRKTLQPLLISGVDEIVFGCTHYPFLRDTAEEIAQGRAAFIDPGEAVARHTAELSARQPHREENGEREMTFYTSGDAQSFTLVLRQLTGLSVPVQEMST